MSEERTKTEFLEYVEKELDKFFEVSSEEHYQYKDEIKGSLMRMLELYELESGYVGGVKSKILLKLFAKLATWFPLTALTGEDDEWEEIKDPKEGDDAILYQNKRCSRVYKRRNGTCFDSQAVLFSLDGITWFRMAESNEDIKEFPYLPPVSPRREMLGKDKKRIEKPNNNTAS